jgi:hypothetical protein
MVIKGNKYFNHGGANGLMAGREETNDSTKNKDNSVIESRIVGDMREVPPKR